MPLPGRAFTRLHNFDVPSASESAANTASPSDQQDVVITKLIKNLADTTLWGTKFLNNEFCKQGYTTDAATFNPKFQAYSKQDYLYLVEYVRLITYRDLHSPPGALIRDDLNGIAGNMAKNVGYVDDFATDCEAMGIAKADLEKELFWAQVLGYTSWQQLTALTDDVFTAYVRMVPCIYGWNKIALNLKNNTDSTPQTDTYFYKYWFEANLDETSANNISTYLDDHIPENPTEDDWKKWNEAFRRGCLFEIAFFEAGLAFQPLASAKTE